MKPGLENSVAHVDVEVTSEMTARLDGREIHPVYSTFWLALHAETAARRALEPYFEDGENAVGAALSISHKAMAPVGALVRVTATVTSVTGNRVECAIRAEATQSRTLLAEGTQMQIVLPIQEIDNRIRWAARLSQDRGN